MSATPRGPMTRFGKVRRQYIWNTLKKGPTEAGYAYFRARRRRRNIADDEPTLSESDRLAISGAFDARDEDMNSFVEGELLRTDAHGTVARRVPAVPRDAAASA